MATSRTMMSACVESVVTVNHASSQWNAPTHVWRPATTLAGAAPVGWA